MERARAKRAGPRLGFKRAMLARTSSVAPAAKTLTAGTNPRPDGGACTEHPLITKAEGIIERAYKDEGVEAMPIGGRVKRG